MHRSLLIATLLTVGTASSSCQPRSDASRTHPGEVTVLWGATLIDGTGSPPVQDAAVVIKDGLILAAGRRGQVEIPANAQSIDVRGKWLMPGMSDAHMHFTESGGLYSRPCPARCESYPGRHRGP